MNPRLVLELRLRYAPLREMDTAIVYMLFFGGIAAYIWSLRASQTDAAQRDREQREADQKIPAPHRPTSQTTEEPHPSRDW